MSRALSILSSGAVTPVGLSSQQTCTAIRAGICAFAQSDFMLQTTNWESIVAASVPLRPRPIDSNPCGRLSALARLALAECTEAAGIDTKKTVLLLGAPDASRAERFTMWYGDDLYAALRSRVVSGFHSASAILPYGNASTFMGLQHARDLLSAGVSDVCIVGGVDSFLNYPDMERMESTWRLHRHGHSYGLIPGEAAAFVAVGRYPVIPQDIPQPVVAGIGLDEEDPGTTVISDGHPTGKGLEGALDKAIRDAGMAEAAIGLRLSDLNGERYGAMDSLLALSRFYRTDRNGLPLWHPAECIGETGAAVGALLIQVASHAIARRFSPSNTVMCEASSEAGHRAACVVHAAE